MKYYDKTWKEIPFLDWVMLMEDEEYRRVSYTQITPETFVSTIRLWIDHNFSWKGDPLIFETMVFSGNKAIDWEQRRDSTEQDAMISHFHACSMAKKALFVQEE